MKKRMLFLAAGFSLMVASQAFAQSESVWEMANADQYGKKAGGMLGRGVINAATCFVDVIVHTVDGTKEGTPFVGTLTGLGSGIACTALRATSGVLDVATFWVPGFNGMPVSRSYSNCIDYSEEETIPVTRVVQTQQTAVPQQPVVQEEPKIVEKKHDAMDYVKK